MPSGQVSVGTINLYFVTGGWVGGLKKKRGRGEIREERATSLKKLPVASPPQQERCVCLGKPGGESASTAAAELER